MFKIVLFLCNFELVDLFDDEAIEQVSCVPFRYGTVFGWVKLRFSVITEAALNGFTGSILSNSCDKINLDYKGRRGSQFSCCRFY